MSRQFKLFGLPAILIGIELFLGWPFLLDVPTPFWLQPLQLAFIPIGMLVGGMFIALPVVWLLMVVVVTIFGHR